MLKYEEVTPAPPLREYIECYWNLQTESSLHNELCLPDGSASFIFNFGNPYFRAECHSPDEWQEIESVSLSHQGKTSFFIKQVGPVSILGVRFRPYGLSSFFRMSHSKMSPPFILQGSQLNGIIGQLGKSLSRFTAFEDWVQMLDQALLNHLPDAEAPDRLVSSAVGEMIKNSGNLRISELHEQLCVSKSTLEKKFQEHVGLSPKILCNILRFNSIVYQGQQVPAPSLTQLTYQQGFFDQSHLVHNFRSFTGLPPGRFFRQKHLLVEMLRQSFEARAAEMY